MTAVPAVGDKVRLTAGVAAFAAQDLPLGTEGVVIDRPDLTRESIYDLAVDFGPEHPAFLVYRSEITPVAGDGS